MDESKGDGGCVEGSDGGIFLCGPPQASGNTEVKGQVVHVGVRCFGLFKNQKQELVHLQQETVSAVLRKEASQQPVLVLTESPLVAGQLHEGLSPGHGEETQGHFQRGQGLTHLAVGVQLPSHGRQAGDDLLLDLGQVVLVKSLLASLDAVLGVGHDQGHHVPLQLIPNHMQVSQIRRAHFVAGGDKQTSRTCFLSMEEFGNGATSQIGDVLKLLDQLSLECEDIRKKSPEHRDGFFATILLHNVGEAQQRHFLPAAPHGRTVDQRVLGK
ncbi:hypothetical protein EYF80_017123 [Liparis tanakae]|uniref:Uncharacterized protein n=1 Tax=Liparis tanakae TaxID=230148 RepID=A0A4Z2I5U0_9TELE|nr:hypothetical protein EYF80_017123 [Liparis tanakae]